MSVPLRINRTNSDPTVNDDETLGYEIGWAWANTVDGDLFTCLDPAAGAAVWKLKPSFEQSSFTPSLEFGGGSTGITYTSQIGNIITIGSALYISAFIALSSKGTSTGEARIVGLPTSNGSDNYAFTFYGHRLTNTTNYFTLGARIAPSENEIRMFEQGSGEPLLALTNTSFADNSQIFLSGFYFV